MNTKVLVFHLTGWHCGVISAHSCRLSAMGGTFFQNFSEFDPAVASSSLQVECSSKSGLVEMWRCVSRPPRSPGV